MDLKQLKEEVYRLERFLGGGLSGNYKAQIIIAGRDKKAWKWFPGNQPCTEIEFGAMLANAIVRKNILGFTGAFFQNREMSVKSQKSFSTACGIDVDAIICEDGNILDIEDLDEESWIEVVEKAIRELGDICSIRTSSGGKGLHFIVRFDKAIGGATPSARKKVVLPIIQRIEKTGLKVDKAGQVLYFLGGLQNWLHVCKNKWACNVEFESHPTPLMISECPTCGSGNIEVDLFSQEGKELIDILYSARVIPSKTTIPMKIDVYIKQVFDALKGTKFSFKTKSSMSEGKGWHANGFIVINQPFLKIFANADNQVVGDYLILEY